MAAVIRLPMRAGLQACAAKPRSSAARSMSAGIARARTDASSRMTSLSITSAGRIAAASPKFVPVAGRASIFTVKATADAAPAPSDPPSGDSLVKAIKGLSWLAFWGQLTLSVVSSVILFFSVIVGGASAAAMRLEVYLTLIGIVCAYVSTFRAYGYKKLGGDLKLALNVFSRSVGINILGMGATLLGLEANVGLLMAKTLTTATQNPYFAGGATKGTAFNPVSALDVFLVQSSTNTLLAHFVGLIVSLWLVRQVALKLADNVSQ